VVKRLTKEDILLDLLRIVPSWRDVDLTRKGYNAQYLDVIQELADYIIKIKEIK
jgi:hypothetical protein